MTEENKLRLRQLGWGTKAEGKHPFTSTRLRTVQETRILKLEKELNDTVSWLERLSERYKTRGYDAGAIDKKIERIRKALK